MKHAYLIIAHGEYNLLNILVNMIDDVRNDIFIHIDKKSPLPSECITVKKSNIYYVVNRVDVRWGDISQIETELILFEKACTTNRYDYYHLLSGVDLPIKSQNFIHDFFSEYAGRNFVGYAQYEVNPSPVMKYHFFTKYYKHNNFLPKVYYSILRICAESMANWLCQRKSYGEWKKGANWVSITDDFCRYLVNRKEFILRRYRYTRCADEYFLQTELWNSSYRSTIYRLDDEFKGCLRLIDWVRGKPYVWTIHDREIIESSNCLFARKFSSREIEIVNWIYKTYS